MAGKAEDFLDSAESFLDAPDQSSGPPKADNFLDAGTDDLNAEDTWLDVGKKAVGRAGHALNAQLGGIEQTFAVARNAPLEFAANTLKGANRLAATGLAYVAPGGGARALRPGGDPLVKMAGNITPSSFSSESVERVKADPLFAQGADRFAYHSDRQADPDLRPNADQWSAKGIAGAAGEAVLTSVLPAMAAGTVGGVVAGLSPMTAQVYGQKIGEMVKAGKPLAEAQDAAGFAVLSEVVPEVVPLSYALKAGAPFWKRVFGTSWREGLQEQVTEILQIEWDKNKGEDISLKDAMLRIAYAGTVGAAIGAPMGAIGAAGKGPGAAEFLDSGPAKAEDIIGNVEDVLGGEARQGAPGGARKALPAPRIIVNAEGEAVQEYKIRPPVDLGMAEVEGAVQGRAPLPEVDSSGEQTAAVTPEFTANQPEQHAMPDGTAMPGATHEAAVAELGGKISPNSPDVQTRTPAEKRLAEKMRASADKNTERYQWMRNKEGGQEYGNQQIVRPLTEADFNAHLKGKLQKGFPTSYAAYVKKFPGVGISLVSKDRGKTFTLDRLDEITKLRPRLRAEQAAWAKKVSGFETPEAIEQAKTADSDVRPAGGKAASKIAPATAQAAQAVAAPATTAQPQAAPQRRQDAATRQKVANMSQEDMRRELLTDTLTGLPNRRANDEADKKPVQAAIDLDSLKWINDEMSHESGDKALAALGQALRESGLEAYHISGDEFIVQGQNRIAIENGMAEVRRRLDNAVIHFEHSDGSTTTKTGVHFSFGIGATRNEADTALSTDKANRQATGRRAARGEAPGGVERRAKGQQDNPDRPAASQEVKPPDIAEQPKQTPPQGGVSASAPEKAEADPSPQSDLFAENVTEAIQATAESTKAVAEAVSGLKDEVADLRQDIASQGEQKKITDLLNDSRIAGITVKVRAVEAESGRKIVYSEKADVALKDVNDRIDKAKLLMDCLNS